MQKSSKKIFKKIKKCVEVNRMGYISGYYYSVKAYYEAVYYKFSGCYGGNYGWGGCGCDNKYKHRKHKCW